MMARGLLNILQVEDDVARGFSAGLAAHAMGTARAFTRSETAGAFSALAMGLNGVATAILAPLVSKALTG